MGSRIHLKQQKFRLDIPRILNQQLPLPLLALYDANKRPVSLLEYQSRIESQLGSSILELLARRDGRTSIARSHDQMEVGFGRSRLERMSEGGFAGEDGGEAGERGVYLGSIGIRDRL